jgi:hypothetical protein
MAAYDRQFVTLSQRLARYGLGDREEQLADLRLERGTQMHVRTQDPRQRERIVAIPIRSAADLKRLIGVPNGAVAQASPAPGHPDRFVSRAGCFPFIPYPAIRLGNAELQANLISYLVNDSSAAVEKELGPLNAFIASVEPVLQIFLCQDIYVAADSSLVVDSKIQTLFANHIFIEDGGSIHMQAPIARIDCAGVQQVHPEGVNPFPPP